MDEDKVIGILMEVKSDVSRIEAKIDSYNGLKEKVDKNAENIKDVDARARSNTHQIAEIKANLTWLWRTIAGFLIGGALSAWVIFR